MDLRKLDENLTVRLANLIPHDSAWRHPIRIFTMTGTFIFWAPLLLIWYLLSPSEWQIPLLVAQVWNMMIVQIMKHTIKRSRPNFGDYSMGVVKFDAYSFPSGHSARAALVMIILPFLFPSYALFWIVWGILTMLSRLLLGVHYVSDILGGFFVGLLSIVPLLFLDFFAPLF